MDPHIRWCERPPSQLMAMALFDCTLQIVVSSDASDADGRRVDIGLALLPMRLEFERV